MVEGLLGVGGEQGGLHGLCRLSFRHSRSVESPFVLYTVFAHRYMHYALVFVAVTIGRLEIMKSPPTRLAVMFFVEPDGIGTAVSVFVSDLVVCMLLGIRTRCVSILQKRLSAPTHASQDVWISTEDKSGLERAQRNQTDHNSDIWQPRAVVACGRDDPWYSLGEPGFSAN